MSEEKKKIKTSIGGQALIEGIMMRGPKKTAMAVRKPDGEIVLEVEDTVFTAKKIRKIPIVRGIFSFADSLITGYKTLMRSAELAFPEDMVEKKDAEKTDPSAGEPSAELTDKASEEGSASNDAPAENAPGAADANAAAVSAEDPGAEEKAAEVPADDAEKTDGGDKKSKKEKKDSGTITEGEMTAVTIIGIVLGLVLAIVLFKFLPEWIYSGLQRLAPSLNGNSYGNNLLRAAITGVLKIAILVGYMAAVSQMNDIRRTFMYHGAEHKSIFCYEHGLELTVENVRSQSRLHPRCGTSFLVLSVIVSILVNMFIPNQLVDGKFLNTLARTGIGLLLLPVTMGFGYELIRIAGRHENTFTRIISAPGMWLQHLTTKEPTPDMIECAIAALKEVIPEDGSDRI